MREMTKLSKVKQNIHKYKKINHATQKTQRQTHGPTGMCELFLLTVLIEEVARCQYKTVKIILPLNLQTITITLDVVKLRGGAQLKETVLLRDTSRMTKHRAAQTDR